MTTIFYGALVSPCSLKSYLALPHALLAVSKTTGRIAWVEEDVPSSALHAVLAKRDVKHHEIELVKLKHGEFLLPGFIDTHTVSHSPDGSSWMLICGVHIACSSGP